MAYYMFFPQKKIISCTFKISDTLIVKCFLAESNIKSEIYIGPKQVPLPLSKKGNFSPFFHALKFTHYEPLFCLYFCPVVFYIENRSPLSPFPGGGGEENISWCHFGGKN
jgi:hypothetical protein